MHLLRDYNEGRHGGWNNYCNIKGQNKGSYVKNKNTQSSNEYNWLIIINIIIIRIYITYIY